jgi:hypothetical protein
LTLNQKMIIVAILSASAMAFAAAGPISGLTALSEEPADDDLFLAYDMSVPMTAAVEYQHLEGGVEYEKIDGYVANAHLDWTVDQGAKNIDVGNIPATFDASIITSGYLNPARGGTGVNSSAYSGLYGYNSGGMEINSKAELEAQIADVSDFAEADGDTYSGTHDFTGATLLAKFKLILTGEAITCASNVCTMSASYTSHYVTTENNSAADVLAVADSATVGTIFRFALTVDGGDAVEVTPASFANGTKFTLNDAGESVTLQWGGTGGWFIVGSHESGDGGLS